MISRERIAEVNTIFLYLGLLEAPTVKNGAKRKKRKK